VSPTATLARPATIDEQQRRLHVRTYSPKTGDHTAAWHVIDATDVVLGRLATHAATLLRGKHKASFAPHMDCGDFVIVINADKVALTGAKATSKMVYRHSGFPGGIRSIPIGELLARDPRRVVENAVKGMLPRTRLGRVQIAKLKVYAGSEHPHAAQQPKAFPITQVAQ
jgi:large subunit ribosomal protein L13